MESLLNLPKNMLYLTQGRKPLVLHVSALQLLRPETTCWTTLWAYGSFKAIVYFRGRLRYRKIRTSAPAHSYDQIFKRNHENTVMTMNRF